MLQYIFLVYQSKPLNYVPNYISKKYMKLLFIISIFLSTFFAFGQNTYEFTPNWSIGTEKVISYHYVNESIKEGEKAEIYESTKRIKIKLLDIKESIYTLEVYYQNEVLTKAESIYNNFSKEFKEYEKK